MTDIAVNVKNGFCDKYLCDTEKIFKKFLNDNANFDTELLPINLNDIVIEFGNDKNNGRIFIQSLSYGQNNVFDNFNKKLTEYHNGILTQMQITKNNNKPNNILSRFNIEGDSNSGDGDSDSDDGDGDDVVELEHVHIEDE